MKIHILGICGTFMAGIAIIAKALGHEVSGSDANIYPPMSDQLPALGVKLFDSYMPDNLATKPDCVIVGNVIQRGNPEMEAVLNKKIPYTSAQQWLADNVLQSKHVIAVAGTHGKTTTASMLNWILEVAGLNPSYLIGGVPGNFDQSARLTQSQYFVIEADEYDSAYFDKRAKFIHYRPTTLLLNNLEFDHADIFENLDAIKKQFNHLIKTIPSNGKITSNAKDKNLSDVLSKGCWTPVTYFNDKSQWHSTCLDSVGAQFSVYFKEKLMGNVTWDLFGEYNISNALAAFALAVELGVEPEKAVSALNTFKNTKRRLEKKGSFHGVTVYDDFAHHPTAIAQTVNAVRKKCNGSRLIAVLEFASYTMRTGLHTVESLSDALKNADIVYLKQPRDKSWDVNTLMNTVSASVKVFDETKALVDDLVNSAKESDTVLVMSNTGFDGFFNKLKEGFSYVR